MGSEAVEQGAVPATVAGYPVQALTLRIAAMAVRLWTVARLEDHVDAAALLRDAQVPEPPYWAHLWPGSRVLARLVAARPPLGGRVLEVGCGLGLAGVVAAMCGATVTLFDTRHEALRFALANARLNDCRVTAVQTDVHTPALRGPFACCLAADVTYDPCLQRALAEFLAAHLAPAGVAYCAESVRTSDDGFRRACGASGLQVTEHHLREVDEGRPVFVRLTEVRRA